MVWFPKKAGFSLVLRIVGMVCPDCEKLAIRVAELEKRLLAYENSNTPSALSKRKRKPRERTGNPLGAPRGHEGITRPTPEPDKIVDIAPLKNCPKCQAELGKPEYYERQLREDTPEPQPVTVTLFRLPHQTCACCGTEIVASHPDCPNTGRFGNNLLAHVTLLKYDGRLPHRKIAEALERDYKLRITPATVTQPSFFSLV